MKIRQLMIGSSLVISMFFVSQAATAQQSNGAGVPARLTVTIEPKKGNEVPTITKDEVLVSQGKDRRPITAWDQAKGPRAGLALAILIDDGSGFSLGTQLNDIRSFITQQAPTTLVGLGYMQNGTVFMAQNFTNDHAAVAKAVRLPQGFFGAEASPYLSLSDFIKRWKTDPQIPRREVLMITSGEDTVYMGLYPNPYAETALRDAQCAGVVVYSIYTPAAGHFGHSYWRSYWGQNYLSQISDESGGESFYFLGPQAPVSFEPYLKKMDSELGNQFLLEFSAMPQKKAGLVPVKIASEIHSVDFLHADRVCVPASPSAQ